MINRIVCLSLMFLGFSIYVGAAEPSVSITAEQVKAMVEKAKPLIEEMAGRKYKNEVKWNVVKRDAVRDVLIQEISPQLNKLLSGMGDDLIARQAEMLAQATSQSLLGKYSFLKKELYIVPDNIKTVAEILGIKDADIEEFTFLVTAHEMVHVLDDQYYDLAEKLENMDNVEGSQAFNALVEGHAVYITNKIADRLKISETARNMAVRSAAGIQNEADRQQQQLFQSIYVKGSEFVGAIIAQKGNAAIDDAFARPPVSTRQIMNPEEYLNGSSVVNIDYKNLLRKVTAELPLEGMRSQSVDLGSMTLHALVVSQGIPEKEAVKIADGCLDGVLFSAARQAIKPSTITVVVINFKNGESAAEFDEMGQKVEKSEIAQFTARLNTSYKLIKEETFKQDGFDFIRYKRVEKKVDDEVTEEISAVGTAGNIYVEMGFRNMTELTENDVLKFMRLISAELAQKPE